MSGSRVATATAERAQTLAKNFMIIVVYVVGVVVSLVVVVVIRERKRPVSGRASGLTRVRSLRERKCKMIDYRCVVGRRRKTGEKKKKK